MTPPPLLLLLLRDLRLVLHERHEVALLDVQVQEEAVGQHRRAALLVVAVVPRAARGAVSAVGAVGAASRGGAPLQLAAVPAAVVSRLRHRRGGEGEPPLPPSRVVGRTAVLAQTLPAVELFPAIDTSREMMERAFKHFSTDQSTAAATGTTRL